MKYKVWNNKWKKWVHDELDIFINPDGEVIEYYHHGYEIANRDISKDVNIVLFTGLKDKNGKEIYEGDIVTTTYGKYHLEPNGLTRFGAVIYNSETASFVISIKNSAIKVSFYDVSKIEIIGNTWESLELLK